MDSFCYVLSHLLLFIIACRAALLPTPSPPSIKERKSSFFPLSDTSTSLAIECTVNSNPRPIISWYYLKDNSPAGKKYDSLDDKTLQSMRVTSQKGDFHHHLVFQGFNAAYSGRYRCEAVNPYGTTVSNVAYLSIITPKTIGADVDQKNRLEANAGETVTMSCGVTPKAGIPAKVYDYSWDITRSKQGASTVTWDRQTRLGDINDLRRRYKLRKGNARLSANGMLFLLNVDDDDSTEIDPLEGYSCRGLTGTTTNVYSLAVNDGEIRAGRAKTGLIYWSGMRDDGLGTNEVTAYLSVEPVEFSLSCIANGGPGASTTVSWTRRLKSEGSTRNIDTNEKFVVNGKQGALFINDLSFSDEGHYTCKAAGEEQTISVKIESVPKFDISSFSDRTVKVGDRVELPCKLVNDLKPAVDQVKWFYGNWNYEDNANEDQVQGWKIRKISDSEQELLIEKAHVLNMGSISCWAANKWGETRHTATLRVFHGTVVIAPDKIDLPYAGGPQKNGKEQKEDGNIIIDARRRRKKRQSDDEIKASISAQVTFDLRLESYVSCLWERVQKEKGMPPKYKNLTTDGETAGEKKTINCTLEMFLPKERDDAEKYFGQYRLTVYTGKDNSLVFPPAVREIILNEDDRWRITTISNRTVVPSSSPSPTTIPYRTVIPSSSNPTPTSSSGKSSEHRRGSLTTPPVVPTTEEVASTPAGSFPWWIIIVIIILLLLLLLFLCCLLCVRNNKGESYYVDEKERQHGRDPVKELAKEGLHEFEKPPSNEPLGYVNPVEMEDDMGPASDSDSLAQYGEIDPGNFNEDGSFIGQYRTDEKRPGMPTEV